MIAFQSYTKRDPSLVSMETATFDQMYLSCNFTGIQADACAGSDKPRLETVNPQARCCHVLFSHPKTIDPPTPRLSGGRPNGKRSIRKAGQLERSRHE